MTFGKPSEALLFPKRLSKNQRLTEVGCLKGLPSYKSPRDLLMAAELTASASHPNKFINSLG